MSLSTIIPMGVYLYFPILGLPSVFTRTLHALKWWDFSMKLSLHLSELGGLSCFFNSCITAASVAALPWEYTETTWCKKIRKHTKPRWGFFNFIVFKKIKNMFKNMKNKFNKILQNGIFVCLLYRVDKKVKTVITKKTKRRVNTVITKKKKRVKTVITKK